SGPPARASAGHRPETSARSAAFVSSRDHACSPRAPQWGGDPEVRRVAAATDPCPGPAWTRRSDDVHLGRKMTWLPRDPAITVARALGRSCRGSDLEPHGRRPQIGRYRMRIHRRLLSQVLAAGAIALGSLAAPAESHASAGGYQYWGGFTANIGG